MRTLKQVQSHIIDVINNGPDTLDNNLFYGSIDRVLLGLKAHANTINHARLLSMEASFPRCMAQMGSAEFNQIARAYVETAAARRLDNNRIGAGFAAFLQSQHVAMEWIDLARIEWAWLQSYHSIDGEALSLTHLADLAQAELLAKRVAWHSATASIHLSGAIPAGLTELNDATDTVALLIVRPETEVRLLPLNDRTAQIARAAEKPTTIGNLLALASEQGDETDAIAPVLTLIGAGALVAME